MSLGAAVAAGLHVHEVTPEVLAAMCDTPAPQGLLAVCRPLDVPLDAVLDAAPRLLVVLTHVRDPGNAGTVIRGADAAGADAVLVSDASVDVYNPKVRAVHRRLPVPPAGRDRRRPSPTLLHDVRAAGLRLLAADGAGTDLLHDVGPRRSAARLGHGQRGVGPRPEVRRGLPTRSCGCRSTAVPRSLNLAMAATVCLYASATAQRGVGQSG